MRRCIGAPGALTRPLRAPGLFLGVTYVRSGGFARAEGTTTADANATDVNATAALPAPPHVALWFALAQTQRGLDTFLADAVPHSLLSSR